MTDLLYHVMPLQTSLTSGYKDNVIVYSHLITPRQTRLTCGFVCLLAQHTEIPFWELQNLIEKLIY